MFCPLRNKIGLFRGYDYKFLGNKPQGLIPLPLLLKQPIQRGKRGGGGVISKLSWSYAKREMKTKSMLLAIYSNKAILHE